MNKIGNLRENFRTFHSRPPYILIAAPPSHVYALANKFVFVYTYTEPDLQDNMTISDTVPVGTRYNMLKNRKLTAELPR